MTRPQFVRALAMSLVCVVSAHESAAAQIRGTATFRERIALPPDAVFDATLEDVSAAGVPSIVLGRARVRGPGSPPIRFQIPFDATRIDPGHRYVVRARILVGARPMLATDQSYPVLTGGNGRQVALVLHRSAATDPTTAESTEPTEPAVAPTASRSAIFTGDLPCPDCTAVRYQLELFPDETYFLRRTYVARARGAASDDIGRWVLSRDGRMLTLFGNLDAPLRIAIGAPNTLHVLGAPGETVASTRRNALRLTSNATPLEPRLRMRGTYRYVGNAGRFTECLTRQSWPVAPERDDAALESAYSRARRVPGDALLVEVMGRVAMRPSMNASGRERMLVVERFGEALPGQSCETRTSAEPLENVTRTERSSRAARSGK
ncbi:MAG: YbaY family lipoprotein [Gemmatimonadaceae bacterium]